MTKGVRLATLAVVVGLVGADTTPASWSVSSSAAAKRPSRPLLTVRARIRVSQGTGVLTPVQVFFSPSMISVGTVIMVVRNSDPRVAHQLSINGSYSAWMGPNGGTAVMKVTFKRPGTYVAATIGGFPPDGAETGGAGTIKVLK